MTTEEHDNRVEIDTMATLGAAKQAAPASQSVGEFVYEQLQESAPVSPFALLLRSRKFWLAVFAVVQAVVFQFVPNIPDSLWQSITLLVGVLIAAIAHEDAALNARLPLE